MNFWALTLELEQVSGRLFVRESNLASRQLVDTVVAEGDAKDVRGEILEAVLSTTHSLARSGDAFGLCRRPQAESSFWIFGAVGTLISRSILRRGVEILAWVGPISRYS